MTKRIELDCPSGFRVRLRGIKGKDLDGLRDKRRIMTGEEQALKVVAAFASPQWADQSHPRVWAKQASATVVLLSDDFTDANVVLARQLRCSGVVAAIVRTAGTQRSLNALTSERARRDEVMLALADEVVVFAIGSDVTRWQAARDGLGKPIQIFT